MKYNIYKDIALPKTAQLLILIESKLNNSFIRDIFEMQVVEHADNTRFHGTEMLIKIFKTYNAEVIFNMNQFIDYNIHDDMREHAIKSMDDRIYQHLLELFIFYKTFDNKTTVEYIQDELKELTYRQYRYNPPMHFNFDPYKDSTIFPPNEYKKCKEEFKIDW